MAVYTPLSQDEILSLLKDYSLGDLVSFDGIEQGVSNTNYHLFTSQNRFVLTLFEPHRVNPSDVPGFVGYTMRLSDAGVSCPRTMIRNDGTPISSLKNRPAVISSFLAGQGQSPASVTPDKCKQAGELLARMHLAAKDTDGIGPNHFGLNRWYAWADHIGTRMNDFKSGLYDRVRALIGLAQTHWPSHLPSGAIHGDYFPDNIFFEGDFITGVIDFHFVCRDLFAYDLAIATNAWTFDGHNRYCPDRAAALMQGYESVRPLSKEEHDSLPLLNKLAAMRFLLSRIEEKLAWTPDRLMVPHDPMVFEHRLSVFESVS